MKLESLQGGGDDPGRARRLALAYGISGSFIAALVVCGVAFGGEIKQRALDEVDVKLVKKAEAPKPPPPPPPPPPSPPPKAKVAAATREGPAPAGNSEAPPKEIPKDLPPEGDPSKAKPEAAYDPTAGRGDPRGVVGGKAGGGPPAPTPTVDAGPPAPVAPPPPPAVLPEDATAPVAIDKPMPAYPEEARKQGIEAIVAVSFVVEEDGAVSDVRVVKAYSHPMFDDVVVAAVRGWRFKPATLEGKPIRVRRHVRVPFKLRTQ